MVAVAIVVLMFGGIYLTIGTGHWATSRTAAPVTLESGEYDPADIRGSYAFTEIEKFFGVPTVLLFDAFILPEEKRTETFMIKDMHEELFAPVVIEGTEIEVGTDLVRVFTSLYTGLPYESTETTHLPKTVVDVLIKEQKLDDEQKAYWEAHTFDLVLLSEAPETSSEDVQQVSSEKPPQTPEEAEKQSVLEIKGSTTIGAVLDAGLTGEQFKEITSRDLPEDRAVGLKDFADQQGLDMETVKTKIIEALGMSESASEEAPQHSNEQAAPEAVSIEIKGSTTMGGLFDYGLTKEQFKEITGLDMPDDKTVTFKDFTDEHGLDRESLKTKITEALQP